MTPPRPLLAPTVPGPYRASRPADAYDAAHYQFSEAEAALAATAYEHLGTAVREFSPDIACIDFERTDDGPLLHSMWTGPHILPPSRPLRLWRREPDPYGEHRWLKDAEQTLLELLVYGEKLPIMHLPGRARERYLLNLLAPDVAAALAALIRRQHPHAAALLLNVDSAPYSTDFQIAHVLDHNGHSLNDVTASAAEHAAPGGPRWRGNNTSISRAVRHLWLHPEHRARYFRPQGYQSHMWNQGIQALVLPAIPALPGPSAT
ncbi:hypothetical protein ACWEO1_31510 [Kitasatospora cineracea]